MYTKTQTLNGMKHSKRNFKKLKTLQIRGNKLFLKKLILSTETVHS